MRLASVIHGPAFGGAHNQLLVLAGPLRERGIESIAVLPPEAEAAAARIEAGGVETVRVPLSRLRASLNPASQLAFASRVRREIAGLEQTLCELGADVVQVHGPTNPQAAVAGNRAGLGVVWQLLDTRAPLLIRRLAMPEIGRRAGAVTVWGRALIDAHPGAAQLEDRLHVVYPPVDAARFAPDAAGREEARAELGVAPDDPLVGTVAQLNPQKGLGHLVSAFAAAGAPGAKLRIIGEAGPAHRAEHDRLERLCGELSRRAPGRAAIQAPGERVAQLLQALDVFVLSSVRRSEGMPTAILEAMAAAKPVVATDVGAVAELVEHGRTGLLVEPGDESALAAAISRLVADAGERSRLGEAGRKAALGRFGLGRLAAIHAAAYEQALAAR